MGNRLGAVNQAVKALIKARAYAAPTGVDFVFKPGFRDIEMDGKVKSVISIRFIEE